MLIEYIPLLLHVLVAIAFAILALATNFLLGRAGKSAPAKGLAYECGMLPEDSTHSRFSVKFYLVAMLFILFDIEIVFMYPWAVVFQAYVEEYGPVILYSMLSFILILLFGYIYAIRKGALDWRER